MSENTLVATREEQQNQVRPSPGSEAVSILQVIERVAANRDFDPAKMKQLLDMQERVLDRQARAAYAAALADMQPEFPVVAERGKGHNDKAYALWEDINERIRPVLARHGFALTFRTGQGDGKITVTAVLTHREGHFEETTMHLPSDASGSKNPVQAVGSSTSYGKRYTALALLNITTGGEDDDGRAAGAGPTISDQQREDLRREIDKVGGGGARAFCDYFKIAGLADLPASQFGRAMKAVRAKAPKPASAEDGSAL